MSLSDQWSPTSVQVTVLQARGLRIKGKHGTNDAYAVMQMGKEKYQTSVAEKSVAPVWKEEASFDMPSAHQGGTERGTLHVHVLHRALVGPDKLLGQAVINNLLQLSEDKSRDKTKWFKLLDKSGKPDKDRGELLVDIQFTRNNLTASMFDISGAGKSRSRLGKFKIKVKGKKKEDVLSESSPNTVPAFSQVMTDSEEEADSGGEGVAAEREKKKKSKVKSLFSHKTNLQKSLSQSMSVLPGKNSSLSGSMSSGLNVEASEGKKKFKFLNHKRTASSDKKEQKLAAEQSNLCINGSHVYCEEPAPRTSRASSNFSLASSGVGSMDDVPDSSPPSVGSRSSVRRRSPWTEEEEEETIEENTRQVDEETLRRRELVELGEEECRREEEERRQREEEEHRIDEENRRQEKMRIEQERLQKEEEEKQAAEIMREEEKRKKREEEERIEERKRMEQEELRRKELEEKERVRREEEEEEERIRLEDEQKRREEEEEERQQEEMRLEAVEKRRREEREELWKLEEERARKETLEEEERKRREERERKEEELRVEKERAEEQRIKEARKREEDERKRLEEEEKIRLEREKERQREEEERSRKGREEQRRLEEEEEEEEEETKRQELLQEQERIRDEIKVKKEEKMRLEKERAEEEMKRQRKEEEEEQRVREEEEELSRAMEEEERRKREEAIEKERLEKERLAEEERRQEERRKQVEERRLEEERRVVEERRLEEERRVEEEMRRCVEERRLEEERRVEEEEWRRQVEEERRRQEEEEEERRRQEEEEERRRQEEEEERRRQEEEGRKQVEEERRRQEKEEGITAEETQRRSKTAPDSRDSTNVTSTNPFDESDEDNLHEENAPENTGRVTSARQRRKLSVERNTSPCGDVSTTQEKRQAPKPPRINSSRRQQEALHEAQVNQQGKDKQIKTASVLPRRAVQPSSLIKNNQPEHFSRTDRSLGRRPAPPRPSPTEEEHKDPLFMSKQTPAVSSLNPFEDGEDVDELDDTTPAASVMQPPSVQHRAEKDTVSSIQIKSSKTAHAPAPPAITTNTPGTDTCHAVTISDIREKKDCAPVQQTSPKESCPVQEEAVIDAPAVPSRRLQPVRPLNPQDQKPVSSLQDEKDKKFTGEINSRGKENVKDAGPYALLTQEELISLVLKQESQLVEKSKKISELEQYIDHLLVRVMEEAPNVLMTITPLK